MSAAVVAAGYGEPAQVVELRERTVAEPAAGRVVIAVRAAGMNPADLKRVRGSMGADPASLPLRLGSEVAGVVTRVGEDATGPAGPIAVGDEVIAYPVIGGYADEVVARAANVFPKPVALGFPAAGNLLLAGTTAAHLVQAVGVSSGGVVLVHGASGGVGLMAVQLARRAGAALVIGTCGAASEDAVREAGGQPVRYGGGLEERVQRLAPRGLTAALDCAGTDEAREVSIALVDDPAHAATIVDFSGAFTAAGGQALGGGPGDPGFALRMAARAALVRDADGAGGLRVRIARTFPLADAVHALETLGGAHPAGSLALVPDAAGASGTGDDGVGPRS